MINKLWFHAHTKVNLVHICCSTRTSKTNLEHKTNEIAETSTLLHLHVTLHARMFIRTIPHWNKMENLPEANQSWIALPSCEKMSCSLWIHKKDNWLSWERDGGAEGPYFLHVLLKSEGIFRLWVGRIFLSVLRSRCKLPPLDTFMDMAWKHTEKFLPCFTIRKCAWKALWSGHDGSAIIHQRRRTTFERF